MEKRENLHAVFDAKHQELHQETTFLIDNRASKKSHYAPPQ